MLENEIALVTGASRGIGEAIALGLGENGATVIAQQPRSRVLMPFQRASRRRVLRAGEWSLM